MPASYTCPIVPQNLRKEETYVQIAEALNYLSDVSEDIFKRVNDRVNANRYRLQCISKRIQYANAKIDQLSGAKNAIQIFSSSRYPAADVGDQPFKSLFTTKDSLPIKRFEYKYKPVPVVDEPLEKLEFFHGPLTTKSTVQRLDGLGGVPNDAQFVGDLLFYNSGKNAYKQHFITDPLERTVKPKHSEQVSESRNLADAPQSITDKNGDPLQQMRGDSYFYHPDIGNVPSLDVPMDLPDLAGIAEDVHYVMPAELSIAPSVKHGMQKVALDASRRSSMAVAEKPLPSLHYQPVVPVAIPKEPPVLPQILPEVPQALPPVAVNIIVEGGDKIDAVEETVQAQSETLPDVEEEPKHLSMETTLPKTSFSPVDDPHATLMEAIRKAAGGRNLKPALDGDAKASTSAESSGDLMTDLHAKLLMRRKGISGNKPGGGGGGADSVMDKISGMIPAPSTKDPHSDPITTEDEEWED